MNRDPLVLQRPWPLVTPLVRQELSAYLSDASETTVRELATRCPPWTVSDLTAHLAATFERLNSCLLRARHGDFAPPFKLEDMGTENLRAVREFDGDPELKLDQEVTTFLGAISDPDEPMAHPAGVVSVGLQTVFALSELTIHHDDVAAARGASYRPPAAVIETLLPVYGEVFGPLPEGGDDWQRILTTSGR